MEIGEREGERGGKERGMGYKEDPGKSLEAGTWMSSKKSRRTGWEG